MKETSGTEVIVSLIILDARRRRVVSFTLRELYPRYTLEKRLCGTQRFFGRGSEEKDIPPCRESQPDLLSYLFC